MGSVAAPTIRGEGQFFVSAIWVRFALSRQTSSYVKHENAVSATVTRKPTDPYGRCTIRLSWSTSRRAKNRRAFYYTPIVRDCDNNRARLFRKPPKNAPKNSGFS